MAAHVSEDTVYYMLKDHSIYQVNLDPVTEQTGKIVAGDNSECKDMENDILIIDGTDVENTATSYLGDIKEFCKISDTCFAVYDGTDKTVKLIGELP